MKKLLYLFTLFTLSISLTCVHAASPTYDDNPPPSYIWGDGGLNPQTSGTPNKTGEDRIVDAISGLDINIGDISIDTSNIDNKLVATYTTQFDTYQQTVGEMLKNISQYYGNDSSSVNRTIFDILNNLVMQYSSITSIEQGVGELVKTSQPTIFKTTRLSSIAANTATQISPISVTGNRNRVFVELRAIDENALFYIGFDSSVTDSNGRPVKGRILLNMPKDQQLYVYHTNASALAIQQTEGWR